MEILIIISMEQKIQNQRNNLQITDPLKIYMQIPKINVTRLTYNEIQKDGKVEEINHTGGNIQINNFVRPQNENSTPQFDSKAYDDFMKSLFDPSITTTEKSILHDERTQNIYPIMFKHQKKNYIVSQYLKVYQIVIL
ncbi:hypothetical protein PVAND_015985 [Polypedilum vanderplanki]|uniref:Uncharacterized protein n=1 Tax=Polypedilum vanderplanki TaxID=319348 RepID=A0A9J6BDU4_POLVA|nr:hypothetical protein PVAND_015985 [Polypedilum vanderplanki]